MGWKYRGLACVVRHLLNEGLDKLELGEEVKSR